MLWLAVALALTVVWCCYGAAAAATPGPCSVNSAETFYRALNNPQCNPLRIESSGLSLTQTSWAAAAGSDPSPALGPICPVPSLVISRNLTVEGADTSSSSSRNIVNIVLNCGYLKSRIAIVDGAIFTLRGLRLANCRQPSALLVMGLDLLTVGAGSQLVLEDVQYECALCPPPAQAVSLALSVPRPAASAAAGQGNQEQQQAVRLVRSSACATRSEQFQSPRTCVSEALLYDDFAQDASGVCYGGVRLPSGGLVRHRNVTQQCLNVISPSCVADKGLGICTREALESLQLSAWEAFDLMQQQQQQQQQKSAGLSAVVAAAVAAKDESIEKQEQEAVVVFTKGDANTTKLLAIVIPTVCGVLALLFGLAGLVVWTRLRKKFAPCPVGLKEAYEGVVFVGLSHGSETGVPTRDLDLEELNLNLNGSASAVAMPGCAKSKDKRGALGPEVLDGVWSGDGHPHRHLPSWDGGLDGRARGSTSVSNCTSTSAPAMVGIIVAGTTPTEAVAASTATTTSTPPMAPSPMLPLAFEVASLQPLPHIQHPNSYHHHHHQQQQHLYMEQRQIQQMQHYQQQKQTLNQQLQHQQHQQQVSDEHQRQHGKQQAALDSHFHRRVVARKTSTTDGGGSVGGGKGGGCSGDGGATNSDAGNVGGDDEYDGPCTAPVNLILGTDVIVTSQPVLGRSPLGSVMLGQYGQIPVAVKMFHRDHMGGSFEELRALREDIDALARTCCPGSHPHVVSVLGTGETPGGDEVFVLEELMASHLLRAIYEGGGLSIERALSIALDVALGLSYLHPTIVHQRLKPESVLLDSSFKAKVADYGLGRLHAFGREARELQNMRAKYMAPEGFNSSERRPSSSGELSATPEADMYSFGVLLWEMLSREVPWRGMDAAQIAMAVSIQQRRLNLPENDRFPPKIRKLIQRCWEQDPAKRPTASEAAKHLAQMLHQERGML